MLHYACDVAYDENMCVPIGARKCRSINWLINYMIVSTTIEHGHVTIKVLYSNLRHLK